METITADCGHATEAGRTARNTEGASRCYSCAEEIERAAFATADRFFAYLTRRPDGSLRITTWTGAELATVTRFRVARLSGFGGRFDRYYIRAVAPDGARWYGTGPGPGMYARLRMVGS